MNKWDSKKRTCAGVLIMRERIWVCSAGFQVGVQVCCVADFGIRLALVVAQASSPASCRASPPGVREQFERRDAARTRRRGRLRYRTAHSAPVLAAAVALRSSGTTAQGGFLRCRRAALSGGGWRRGWDTGLGGAWSSLRQPEAAPEN